CVEVGARIAVRTAVTHRDPTASFLSAPNGTELCLRELRKGVLHRRGGIGLQYIIWTAVDENDLARCEAVLRAEKAHLRTGSFDGITAVEGRDPEGVSVLISYPAPGDARPSALAPRIYSW
ncbi:MAG: hypothetical protein ACXVXZ_08485, partial [Mycobacteriaceae bacterium]